MADGKGLGLTALGCKTLPDGKHHDGNGLMLLVNGKRRSWVLRYTAPDGRRRDCGLGPFPEVTLKKARGLAADKRHEVRQGIDPLEAKAALRAAAAAQRDERKAEQKAEQATLRRVLRGYHEKHVEPVLTEKHGKQWLASVETHVPAAILDKPITAVEAGELLDALQPLYLALPETARRVRQRLDAVFDHAVLHKLALSNPAKIIVRSLRTKRAKTHFRALPYVEVPAFVSRLRELPGTSARALEFGVLTAARTSEVLDMTWKEVSTDGEVWTVPASRMKAGEAHVVFLSAAARAVLKQMRGLSKRWVFRSPVADAPLSNMAMLLLLRRLEADKQTTVHGLCRASFSTWANETGAARPDVIEACLAHGEANKVRAAYNRAKFDGERRDLLAAWAAYVNTVAADTTP